MDWRVVAAAFFFLPGCTDFSDSGSSQLVIQDVDVSAPVVGTGRLTLAVNVTLDNNGARSGELEVLVKAYDIETDLLVRTASVDVGRIPADKTRTIRLDLDLPRAAGYKLEVEVLQDEHLAREARLTVAKLSQLEPTLYDTGLRIAQMDFLVLTTEGPRATVRTSVYLTNEGATDSRPLSLQLKARENSSGLLADEVWAAVGSIPRDETRAFNGTLSLPHDYNYAVEALLWDGNVIVERGEGSVQFAPTEVVEEGQDVVVKDVDLDVFRSPAEDAEDESYDEPTPGFGAAALVVALLAAIALVRRRMDR